MKKTLALLTLASLSTLSYAQNNGIIWQEIVNSKVTNISASQPTTPPAELDKVKAMLSQSRQNQTCFVGDPANDFTAGVNSACPGAKLAKGSNPNYPYLIEGNQCNAPGITKMKLEFNRISPNEYMGIQTIDFKEPNMQYQVSSQVSLKKIGQACDPKTFNTTQPPDPQFVKSMNQAIQTPANNSAQPQPNVAPTQNSQGNKPPAQNKSAPKSNTPSGLR